MPETVRRGRLKLLLGYAAGVGKTYQMLEEAQKLKRQGIDVAIGFFEPHGRKDTIAKTQGLAVIPRRQVSAPGKRVRGDGCRSCFAARAGGLRGG